MSAGPRPNDAAITQAALICKIIASALIGGVLAFAAVAIVIRRGQPAEGTLISFIGAGGAAAMVVARQVVLGLMSTASAKAGTSHAGAIGLYVTRLIIGYAVLEGAAFFNLIAYLLEGNWWSLAIAAALVALMLAAYPTRARIRQWVEDREQLKTFGPGEPR